MDKLTLEPLDQDRPKHTRSPNWRKRWTLAQGGTPLGLVTHDPVSFNPPSQPEWKRETISSYLLTIPGSGQTTRHPNLGAIKRWARENLTKA
jgi:hypothetical protein